MSNSLGRGACQGANKCWRALEDRCCSKARGGREPCDNVDWRAGGAGARPARKAGLAAAPSSTYLHLALGRRCRAAAVRQLRRHSQAVVRLEHSDGQLDGRPGRLLGGRLAAAVGAAAVRAAAAGAGPAPCARPGRCRVLCARRGRQSGGQAGVRRGLATKRGCSSASRPRAAVPCTHLAGAAAPPPPVSGSAGGAWLGCSLR